MTNIPSEFIVKLQGKEYVTHDGLLNLFHTGGGTHIETELLSTDPCIFKATVHGEKGTFVGHGDADATNVNKMIAKHMLRMAETRAINRALRFYNNIGMCSIDELGGDDQKQEQTKIKEKPKTLSIEQVDTIKQKLQDAQKTPDVFLTAFKVKDLGEIDAQYYDKIINKLIDSIEEKKSKDPELEKKEQKLRNKGKSYSDKVAADLERMGKQKKKVDKPEDYDAKPTPKTFHKIAEEVGGKDITNQIQNEKTDTETKEASRLPYKDN